MHASPTWVAAQPGAEPVQNQVKLCTRKAYGFRTFDAIQMALYHQLGELPEPELAHESC